MDGPVEHSDSDSGESWTLLDSSPAYADGAPSFPDSPVRIQGDTGENTDKDDDTDGISVISDSDHESITPIEIINESQLLEGARPADPQTQLLANQLLIDSAKNDQKSIRDNDFLVDSNRKLKTYVHRRNKRLSTVLNIILLGSVITAAGVAIGHMWGAKHDCIINNAPSVNKILSNLYKLQEENAYLRNKLKELTLINQAQSLRKGELGKTTYGKNKCMKVFEESLSNKNADKLTKCVDQENNAMFNSASKMKIYEKEFLNDIDKLKNIYQQNKSWLDDEINRRLKYERHNISKYKDLLKSNKSTKIPEDKTSKPKQLESIIEDPVNLETIINITEPIIPSALNVVGITDEKASQKIPITYADSLKSSHKTQKRENMEINIPYKLKTRFDKKKKHKVYEGLVETSSEEELQKDNRHVNHKLKIERKKGDRHRALNKQKRRNKYEQWEMKGGYMKDYDDFSISSIQENEFILKKADMNHFSRDFELQNYLDKFSDANNDKSSESKIKSYNQKPDIEDDTSTGVEQSDNRKAKVENRTVKREKAKKEKSKDTTWYETRVILRNEARKKLEQELLGETTPNNANWYFRRMVKREQCRLKGDNITNKKYARKRLMNFKTKH